MRYTYLRLRRQLDRNRSRPKYHLHLETLEDRATPATGVAGSASFVTGLYGDLLRRAPDAAGLAQWSSALDAGRLNRMDMVRAFQGSREFAEVSVRDTYQRLLRRAPDPAGLTTWVTFLNGGGTQTELDARLIGSAEYYVNRGGGTDAGFLRAVYTDVFSRGIDPSGLLVWGRALANPTAFLRDTGFSAQAPATQLVGQGLTGRSGLGPGDFDFGRPQFIGANTAGFFGGQGPDPILGSSLSVPGSGFSGSALSTTGALPGTISSASARTTGFNFASGVGAAGFPQGFTGTVTVGATGVLTAQPNLGPSGARTVLAWQLLTSEEGSRRIVQDFYTRFLGRPADAAGLANFAPLLQSQPLPGALPQFTSTGFLGNPGAFGLTAAQNAQLFAFLTPGRGGTGVTVQGGFVAQPGVAAQELAILLPTSNEYFQRTGRE